VTARRRRGLLLLALALASGGLAASQVRERERRVEAQVGPLVPVLVAARDLRAGARLSPGSVQVRRVPARFVPPDALSPGARLGGARAAVPVSAGGYITAALFSGNAPDAAGVGLAAGERSVEVGVAGGSGLEGLAARSRVDVVVSTESGAGGGRSFVALADVELLALRADPAASAYAGEDSGAGSAPSALATLRVTLRQAVYLTAADNFGREIRLLARPPGDRSRGGAVISAAEL